MRNIVKSEGARGIGLYQFTNFSPRSGLASKYWPALAGACKNEEMNEVNRKNNRSTSSEFKSWNMRSIEKSVFRMTWIVEKLS
jgi:hypothetical protein